MCGEIKLCVYSNRRAVGQENVTILQHLQSDRRSGASTELFLNRLIQFYLNNVTDKSPLVNFVLFSTTSCPTTWRSYIS